MFRFTIRDVLWLTVVVAVAVCWWLDHRQISPGEREFLSKLKRWSSLNNVQNPPPEVRHYYGNPKAKSIKTATPAR